MGIFINFGISASMTSYTLSRMHASQKHDRLLPFSWPWKRDRDRESWRNKDRGGGKSGGQQKPDLWEKKKKNERGKLKKEKVN